MKINDLRYVLMIEKEGSFNKAARKLYMKQPRLSKSIKDLEEELHYTLFIRSYKGVELSDKGKEFVQQAKKIISEIDDLKLISVNNILHIHIYSVRSEYIKKAFIKYLHIMDSPKYDIHYNEANSLDTIKAIDEYHGDIGIIRYQSDYEYYYLDILNNRHINYQKLKKLEYYITVSKQCKINIEQLYNYVEIYHQDERMTDFLMINHVIESEHPRIQVNEKLTQIQMICDIPDSYMWSEKLDDTILEKYHLQQIKYPNLNTIKDLIIYRHLSEQTQQFIHVITNNI